jgi:hypothetical protein
MGFETREQQAEKSFGAGRKAMFQHVIKPFSTREYTTPPDNTYQKAPPTRYSSR